nr:zinc ribbon domain-containing protein [uncultured Flavobacterium sp.]
MALMFCPDCGKEVSDNAINCPNCAYPLSKLKNSTKISSINYQNNELIIVGYIAVFLSFFIFPIFFMLIGLILGIVNLSKGAVGHGILQIILSLVFGILGTLLGILSLFF